MIYNFVTKVVSPPPLSLWRSAILSLDVAESKVYGVRRHFSSFVIIVVIVLFSDSFRRTRHSYRSKDKIPYRKRRSTVRRKNNAASHRGNASINSRPATYKLNILYINNIILTYTRWCVHAIHVTPHLLSSYIWYKYLVRCKHLINPTPVLIFFDWLRRTDKIHSDIATMIVN